MVYEALKKAKDEEKNLRKELLKKNQILKNLKTKNEKKKNEMSEFPRYFPKYKPLVFTFGRKENMRNKSEPKKRYKIQKNRYSAKKNKDYNIFEKDIEKGHFLVELHHKKNNNKNRNDDINLKSQIEYRKFKNKPNRDLVRKYRNYHFNNYKRNLKKKPNNVLFLL